jgi:hypothetical protein
MVVLIKVLVDTRATGCKTQQLNYHLSLSDQHCVFVCLVQSTQHTMQATTDHSLCKDQGCSVIIQRICESSTHTNTFQIEYIYIYVHTYLCVFNSMGVESVES